MIDQFGLIPGDLKNILTVLLREPAIERAVLFGSRAKGTYTKGSDVDIALFGNEITSVITSRIRYILNEETLLPYTFDVLNFDAIENPALKNEILSAGSVVLEKKSDGNLFTAV